MSTVYDPIRLTKLLIFGTEDLSSVDYNDLIRPMGATPAAYHMDMQIYMEIGGGRYAYPSLFKSVEKFFDTNFAIADGIYTFSGGTIDPAP